MEAGIWTRTTGTGFLSGGTLIHEKRQVKQKGGGRMGKRTFSIKMNEGGYMRAFSFTKSSGTYYFLRALIFVVIVSPAIILFSAEGRGEIGPAVSPEKKIIGWGVEMPEIA